MRSRDANGLHAYRSYDCCCGICGHSRPRSRCHAKGVRSERLLRAYTAQIETLHRLRHGGSQFVRVEHVQVNEGGQALIGNVRKDGGEGQK